MDGAPRLTDNRVPTIQPATGEPLAEVHLASPADVEAAVRSAATAQQAWAAVPVPERARAVAEVARRLTERAQDFGLLDALDTGTPIRTMRAGALKGADYLATAAGVAMEFQGRTIPASGTGWHLTLHRPLGVVVGITAFNHPTLFACQKLGPALLAGNAVVLKSSEQAPASAVALAALTADVLPPGLVSVLSGDAECGRTLLTRPEVAAVSFTGSVKVGLDIQETLASARRFTKVLLELGGKNPFLAFADADLDAAAEAVVRGMNYTRNQGQSCGSTSRLLVHQDIHEALVKRVVDLVGDITMGLPDREETQMGSLISTGHRDRVLAAVRRAEQQGARLVAGGRIPEDPALARGAYLEPTVFDHVDESMDVARDELFGPVLAVMPCRDEAEMIRIANNTDYGLTAAIWSQDIDRALAAAERIEAGYVWINDVETRYKGVPHVGWKQSGIGLEQALTEEIREFSRTKSVNLAIRPPF